MAREPGRRRYSRFRKLVSKTGTWQLQAAREASMVSFNASSGTAFVAGKRWFWKEIGGDHVRVIHEGEKFARDWKWELSDDRQVVRVVESNIDGSPAERQTFSLVRALP